LTLTRERGERGYEASALCLLGEIGAHRHPLDAEAAEGHYRKALAVAADLEMRPLVARCNLGLGALHRRTGKPREALEYLTVASTMFRGMQMPFWLEKTEAVVQTLT
jgi:hypothetical protein